MNLKRINAIFIKEFQDIRTNWNQLFMYILPILLTFLYSKFIPPDQIPKGMALSMGLLMLVAMSGIMLPAMMVAEEKEKRTLEVLLLSPAKPVEVFFGKSLVTFILIIVCSLIVMLISGGSWDYLPVILASTCLISVFCILFGLIAGIFSKSQMSTGVICGPFAILFLLPPFFAFSGVKSLEGISKVFPTYYYLDLLKKATYDGAPVMKMLNDLGVLAASILIGCVILFAVYRKKGLE